jgi:hypothetical protein
MPSQPLSLDRYAVVKAAHEIDVEAFRLADCPTVAHFAAAALDPGLQLCSYEVAACPT